jgi:hypothetical protein
VGSGQVVVDPPFRHHPRRLRQVPELVLVQAFIPKLAVEALDVGILHRFSWVYEVELHSAFLRPAEHGLASKLRTVVQHQHLGQTSVLAQFLQHPNYPLP